MTTGTGHADQGFLAATLPVRDLAVGSVAAMRDAAARAGGFDPDRPRPERVAAAFTSDRLLRVDGAPVDGFAPLSGFFRTADGWVRTHANYPHHRVRLLALLDLPVAVADAPSRDDVAAALAVRSAQEVEDRAATVGAIAVRVRSVDEWRASAPGRAAASGPPVRTTVRDDVAPRARSSRGPGRSPASASWISPASSPGPSRPGRSRCSARTSCASTLRGCRRSRSSTSTPGRASGPRCSTSRPRRPGPGPGAARRRGRPGDGLPPGRGGGFRPAPPGRCGARARQRVGRRRPVGAAARLRLDRAGGQRDRARGGHAGRDRGRPGTRHRRRRSGRPARPGARPRDGLPRGRGRRGRPRRPRGRRTRARGRRRARPHRARAALGPRRDPRTGRRGRRGRGASSGTGCASTAGTSR